MESNERTACVAACLALAGAAWAGSADEVLVKLRPGDRPHGFEAVARYLGAEGKVLGAAFRHQATGVTVDLLSIESAPQAFLWVNSFPDSDRGEPHTQEHLLLGKGNVGRAVAGLETMRLASSSAFTEQWRTCYHFHATAGGDAFFTLLQAQMEALLRPDYTDEEIRREVRNFGVAQDPDGTLRLEEKGTVYNEMVSTFGKPYSRLFDAMGRLLYGPRHPLSFDSGGLPAAIREMTPEHIRAFHARAYRLANFGMIVALPASMDAGDSLERLDGVLRALAKDARDPRPPDTEASMPAPSPAAAGTMRTVEFPSKDPSAPGAILLAFPPTRHLTPDDYYLLEQFLANMASDATTNLYKIFIDGKTRDLDVGASNVAAWASSDQGMPVYVLLSEVSAAKLDDATLQAVRKRILAELKRVADLPAGSPELQAFHARMQSRLMLERRALRRFVGAPPGFGFRGTGSEWMDRLRLLAWRKGFDRSVVLEPELGHVEATLLRKDNPWREAIDRWKLADAPFVVAVRPSPALLEKERDERTARLAAEVARLQELYALPDGAQAIRRYQADDDAKSRELEALEAALHYPPLLSPAPMTLDDGLTYRVETVEGAPYVASTVDTMSGGTIGLALSLRALPEEHLPYLSLLPALITEVGVVRDGVPVSHEEMSEALKREVLDLDASFDADHATRRAELIVRGSGTDLGELAKAAGWMRLALTAADFRKENLPRIRDVVEQSLQSLRTRMQRREEAWVDDPARAYRYQDDRLLLRVGSFLTRTHDAHRLKWELQELPAGESGKRTLALLDELAALHGPRGEREALLAAIAGDGKAPEPLRKIASAAGALPPEARELARDAAADIGASLAGVPDDSFDADWIYLCRQLRLDLAQDPEVALGRLDRLRKAIAMHHRARFFSVAPASSAKEVTDIVVGLAGTLTTAAERIPAEPTPYLGRHVDARLSARHPGAPAPLFVGLVVPSLQGGVFLHSAPLATYLDTDPAAVRRVLSGALLAGHGAHGAFMKTWAAGLAYSNGFRPSLRDGLFRYYAERTPELPQTLAFVISEVKGAEKRAALLDYAVAQIFSASRAAESYEGRAESMAEDIADGVTPERVRAFRTAVLAARADGKLLDEIFALVPEVYGSVLPGYGKPSREVKDGVFFVIGSDQQLDRYEAYLASAEGKDAKLHRLYPRDFWMPGPAAIDPPAR